jgi:hypothetical protein
VFPSEQSQSSLDLIKAAFALYRQHARVFLLTAAVLFVPGALVSSCALSITLAPLDRQVDAIEDVGKQAVQRSEALTRRIEAQRKSGKPDVRVMDELARENKRNAEEMSRAGGDLARRLKRGLLSLLMSLLGWAMLALILYGLVVPLTQGALVIAVADRMFAGQADWREHWKPIWRRLGRLLSALVPASLMYLVGSVFLLLPGLTISLFFSFVAPVVLVEGLGGQAALRRSFELVRADWLRVLPVLVMFVALNGLTHALAGVIVPGDSIFLVTFVGNLISLLLMPIPIILSVLLYLDARRRADGFTSEELAEALAGLRAV